MSSKKIAAANWKLNKNPSQTREFFQEWKAKASALQCEVAFFPPATSLETTGTELKGTAFQFGSQNCCAELSGAFTGEVSAQVVADLGGRWILIGHSERRTLFGETDSLVAKKVETVLKLGLTPMLCIGETLAERDGGKTNAVLEKQLREGLAKADKKSVLALAYEPVWAIGTGKVAGPEQVADAHKFIFGVLKELGFSENTPILYGGSVKSDNARTLANIPHVGGFLVGGASLDVSSFLQIAQACQ